MTGTITAYREAVLPLTVRGPNGQELRVNTVVDTGFTDFLTLPTNVITALGLPRIGGVQASLADGSEVDLDLYRAVVLWHDRQRAIDVLRADSGPLLGMALLYGSRLTMDILDGAPFTLDPAT